MRNEVKEIIHESMIHEWAKKFNNLDINKYEKINCAVRTNRPDHRTNASNSITNSNPSNMALGEE